MNEKELIKYRKEIEFIDEEIFSLLKKRFEIVEKIGEYKKIFNLPIRNQQREVELIEKMSKKYSMDKKFVEDLYHAIFNNSYKIEK